METTDIREYAEGYSVEFDYKDERVVVRAFNQGKHDCTEIDLLDLLKYVKEQMPELY